MSGQERCKDPTRSLPHSFVPGPRRSPSPFPNLPTGPSFLLLLPSELKHRIAELSSHESLASLARTHTAFQREAEQALYRTLSDPSLKCLETLATNSEKAGFIHFLTMECDDHINEDQIDHWQAPIDYLLNALVNMHSLSDFRLRLPRCDKVQPWIESLDKILCDDHFRLQTLCCHEDFDLSRIITSQTELQKLGIYVDHGDGLGFLGTLKQLQNAQLHLPVVFTLDYCGYVFEQFERTIGIGIFPPFYDCHPTVHQILAESFVVGQDSNTLADPRGIDELSIYLADSCDLPSIQVLTTSMSMTCPYITSLVFLFENPPEKIPSQEIGKIISLFSNLSNLAFKVWSPLVVGDGDISGDVKRAHEALAKDWVLACPELVSVSFIDGSMLDNLNENGGSWE